jgi:hypothetical protein
MQSKDVNCRANRDSELKLSKNQMKKNSVSTAISTITEYKSTKIQKQSWSSSNSIVRTFVFQL